MQSMLARNTKYWSASDLMARAWKCTTFSLILGSFVLSGLSGSWSEKGRKDYWGCKRNIKNILWLSSLLNIPFVLWNDKHTRKNPFAFVFFSPRAKYGGHFWCMQKKSFLLQVFFEIWQHPFARSLAKTTQRRLEECFASSYMHSNHAMFNTNSTGKKEAVSSLSFWTL